MRRSAKDQLRSRASPRSFERRLTSVGDSENLIEVGDSLLVLDLDDDLDVGSLGTKDLPDGEDVVGGSDERGEDHVDSVLDSEEEIPEDGRAEGESA